MRLRPQILYPCQNTRPEGRVFWSLSKILFDKLSKHFQNLHKSSENAVIENERHP